MYGKKTMKSAIESMMFVWGDLLPAKDAATVLGITKNEVLELFRELQDEYEELERGIQVREVNESFQFITDSKQEIFVKKLCTPVKIKKLSQAALEVLAIIAYRQPVTRGEVDSIRGIKCDRVLDGLMDKKLIEVVGRSEGVGRPLLYGTTNEFLKKFGLTTLADLPIVDGDTEQLEAEESEHVHAQLNLNFDEATSDENK